MASTICFSLAIAFRASFNRFQNFQKTLNPLETVPVAADDKNADFVTATNR